MYREQHRADDYCREQLRLAVQAADVMPPRRWLAQFGCMLIVHCSSDDAGLSTAYVQARKRMELRLPKQQENWLPDQTYSVAGWR